MTLFLAIWGAFLSSVTFGWNLFRDLRDRAKLKLRIRVRRIGVGQNGKGYAISPDLPIAGASSELYLVARAVNIGRRPMQWEGWGGEYYEERNGRKGFVIVGEDLPKMLAERESHSERTLLEGGWLPNVKRLFIWDASGKSWKLSLWQMHKLRTEAEKALRENTAQPSTE
ncbi:MAG: hypothetical protein ABR987_02900 [Terracidiphilus sp.]|jgi:hypothetical protein